MLFLGKADKTSFQKHFGENLLTKPKSDRKLSL